MVYEAIVCVGIIPDIKDGFVRDSGWMDEEALSVLYA
jgi:hypothetical protein